MINIVVIPNQSLEYLIILSPVSRRICRENSKYVLDEIIYGNFHPRRKAANFCHPGMT